MKLHFKKGAVVRFFLNCELDACGKVIEVTEDQVVFVPQEYVSLNEYQESAGTRYLDPSISVDKYPLEEIHLNRANIVMWSYESIPCNNDTTYFGVLCPSKIVDSDSINFYEGGFCKGYGDYFE